MSAYYNEFDPAAAAWLRELIANNLIAPGDVDTRSIKDVSADDLRRYDQCHFFAGIGIWSHALRRAGWEDGRRVWTGSCPCQPFSPAGKGLGFEDPRHLWPDWFRLIAECRPDRIFGEQSANAGAWLDLVRADLEARSYAFASVDIPAAGFEQGAHIRQRFYWVADADPAERWADMAPRDFRDWPKAGRIEGYGEPRAGGAAGGLGHAGGVGSTTNSRDIREVLGLQEGQRPEHGAAVPGGPGAAHGMGYHHHHPGLALGSGRPDERGALRVEGPAFGASGSLLGCDWLLCHDARIRPVEAGTFPLAATDPSRLGRLRGYGNALDAEAAVNFIGAFMDASEACEWLS